MISILDISRWRSASTYECFKCHGLLFIKVEENNKFVHEKFPTVVQNSDNRCPTLETQYLTNARGGWA